MHESVRRFVAEHVDLFDLAGTDTLEVGSYDVNGSVRDLFTGSYTGVDMRCGPGVDAVAAADGLPFADRSFGAVVSTEMLEHDARPWLSVNEMGRVLRPGGWLLLTCRGFDSRGCFPLHEYPDDLWRFTTRSVRLLLEDAGMTDIRSVEDPQTPGVFAAARKP